MHHGSKGEKHAGRGTRERYEKILETLNNFERDHNNDCNTTQAADNITAKRN